MSPFHHDFAAAVLADDAVCACVDGVAQAAVTLESSADYPPVPPSPLPPVPLPALRPFALALGAGAGGLEAGNLQPLPTSGRGRRLCR